MTDSGPAAAGTRAGRTLQSAVLGGRGGDLQVADLRYQASIPCSSQKRPTASTEAAEARASASAAASPKRSVRVAKLSQSELTKPPFRPLGP